MRVPPRPATAAAPQGARRARWQRQLAVVGALSVGIALLLTTLEGGRFGVSLVYSLCIGTVCTAIVHATRWAAARLTRRARHADAALPAPARCGDADAPLAGWRGVMPGALLALVLGAPLGLWIGDRLTGYRSPSMANLGEAGPRATLLLTLLATLVAVAVLSALERAQAARAQAEAAQRLAAENQLKLLQSQLEPHMLFNTLANLRVLIGVDPARAQAMLDRLIAFLRATLQASRADAHPLAAEFAHLADYLALIGVRMGPRLAVGLHLPDELAPLPVPPLLLQPLVENAVKHGIEPCIEGGRIDVGASAEGGMLVLTVSDTGAALPSAAGAGAPVGLRSGLGFGLEQLRSRLTALHGSAAGFELRLEPPGPGGRPAATIARLRLPLPAPPAPPAS